MGRITDNRDFLDKVQTSISGDSMEEIKVKVLGSLTSVMIDISKSLAWIADSVTSLEQTIDGLKETLTEANNKDER